MRADNLLVRKLGNYARLSTDDVHLLREIATTHGRWVAAGDIVANENEPAAAVKVILDGWAYRYKVLADGRRQILAVLLPGDVCDLNVFILRRMDHSIGTWTAVHVMALTREIFELRLRHSPRLIEALWWESLVSAAIQREWTLSLGKRTAFERLGHLFCELYLRLRAIGLTRAETCDFPMTQADIGDMAGLSTVHVNRTLQELRAEKLISLRGRSLAILDLERLKALSFFNAAYLHLDHAGEGMDADEA